MTTPVLSIRDLTVDIPTRQAVLRPVDRVSYDIQAGEILGVVGESGAGKSMAGNAVIGLLTPPVGMLLYVITGVSNVEMGDILRDLSPFLIAIVLLAILKPF